MPLSKRKTKIVCTIGPSTNTPEKIRELVDAGMDVVRLNFSHGSHAEHKKVIEHIRQVSDELKVNISILMDLQGPKIRVGLMKDGSQFIETGQYVNLTPEDIEGNQSIIPIDYPYLFKDAKEGDTILMDDGLLEFRIIKVEESGITARCEAGGELKSRKGVNLPNVNLSISAITEKDVEDLDFGLAEGIDFVALSFVRFADDVQEIISKIRARGSNAGVIAKLEKPEALNQIDEIIEEADGLMVARGDLGIELASERVPLIQKRIIKKCKQAGKPVITATQMLESMIVNPRPTRAESSDVANAVLDGTDAVMLSGESAVGKYPIDATRQLDKICRNMELRADSIYRDLEFNKPEWKEKQIVESLSYSCISISDSVDAKAIAVITHSGTTAKRIAKYRPEVPVVAFTESVEVLRQLNLVWGVSPIKLDKIFDTEESVKLMEEYLKDDGLVTTDDRVVLATGIPVAMRGRTNMVKVSTIA